LGQERFLAQHLVEVLAGQLVEERFARRRQPQERASPALREGECSARSAFPNRFMSWMVAA
jgi:hypothetical protein